MSGATSAEVAATEVTNAGVDVTPKKWNLVAVWSWDVQTDTCAICKGLIADLCLLCLQGGANDESNKCPVAIGQCNHAFHLHCISRWVKEHNTCPCDATPWELSSVQEA